MKRKTERELCGILLSLQVLSCQDDLEEREYDVIYNLYGVTREAVIELLTEDAVDDIE